MFTRYFLTQYPLEQARQTLQENAVPLSVCLTTFAVIAGMIYYIDKSPMTFFKGADIFFTAFGGATLVYLGGRHLNNQADQPRDATRANIMR